MANVEAQQLQPTEDQRPHPRVWGTVEQSSDHLVTRRLDIAYHQAGMQPHSHLLFQGNDHLMSQSGACCRIIKNTVQVLLILLAQIKLAA